LFRAAAELGLEGIVWKRARSLYRGGPSRDWLKTKNMVEGEFILLGTERDSDGVPWALLASDRDGRLEFAGPAILNPEGLYPHRQSGKGLQYQGRGSGASRLAHIRPILGGTVALPVRRNSGADD
jgi:hypothetical protein